LVMLLIEVSPSINGFVKIDVPKIADILIFLKRSNKFGKSL